MAFLSPGNAFIPAERREPKPLPELVIVPVPVSSVYQVGDAVGIQYNDGVSLSFCRMAVNRIVDATHIELRSGAIPNKYMQLVPVPNADEPTIVEGK